MDCLFESVKKYRIGRSPMVIECEEEVKQTLLSDLQQKRLVNGCDAVDLDNGVPGYSSITGDGRTNRRFITKTPSVSFIHAAEVIEIIEKDRHFQDPVHRRSDPLQILLYTVEADLRGFADIPLATRTLTGHIGSPVMNNHPRHQRLSALAVLFFSVWKCFYCMGHNSLNMLVINVSKRCNTVHLYQ